MKREREKKRADIMREKERADAEKERDVMNSRE